MAMKITYPRNFFHERKLYVAIEVHLQVPSAMQKSPSGPLSRYYPGFCNMKRLGVFLLPLDGMLVTPSIKFAGTHLYTSWVERGTISVNCLTQEHNPWWLLSINIRIADLIFLIDCTNFESHTKSCEKYIYHGAVHKTSS